MPKNMGDSDNTTTVDNTRIHIFNEYHKNNFKFFVEDTTAEYVEQYNIKVSVTDYSNWLATTGVTKFFDEYLQSNRNLNLNTSTLEYYLNKFILIPYEKVPNNCA